MIVFGPGPDWEPRDSKPAAQCERCFLITFQKDRICLPCRRDESDET